MTEKGKSMWLRFFRSAGIPAGFDTKYAVVFDENRIKIDMLMDLNKECLRDMGITAMGDIIAILKHARIVHEANKEQDFETAKPSSSSGDSSVKTSVKSVVTSQRSFEDGHPKSSVPAISSQSKTTSNIQVNATSSTVSRKTVAVSQKKAPAPPSRSPSADEMSDSCSGSPPKHSQKVSSTPVTKKIIILKKRGTTDSEFGEVLREEVPLQKKVRVLPEHEGSYKIKMPEGSIPRTQKLLQSRLGPTPASASTEKKTNVFDRLGGEKGSSSSITSSTTKNSAPSSSEEKVSVKVVKNASIFARLGERQGFSQGVSSSSSSQSSKINDDDFMQTKFQIRRQIDPPSTPIRPKPDPAVYREKTLTTIPSRIYSPIKSQTTSSFRLAPRLSVRSEVKPVIDNKVTSGIKYRLGTTRQQSPPSSSRRSELNVIKFHSDSSDVDNYRESNSSLSSSLPKRSSKVIASAIVKRGSELYDRATTDGEVIKEERILGESGKYYKRRTIIKKKIRGTSNNVN